MGIYNTKCQDEECKTKIRKFEKNIRIVNVIKSYLYFFYMKRGQQIQTLDSVSP